jgi:hypothetical protein
MVKLALNGKAVKFGESLLVPPNGSNAGSAPCGISFAVSGMRRAAARDSPAATLSSPR